MHIGRNPLGARAILVDQAQLPNTRAQSERHRGRSPDRTHADDADFHRGLLSSLRESSANPSASTTAETGTQINASRCCATRVPVSNAPQP